MRLLSFVTSTSGTGFHAAVLFCRVLFGLPMAYHGVMKVVNHQTYLQYFPDPIGLGAVFSFWLVVFSELVGGIAVAVGVLTRFFLLFIFGTLSVAFFLVHAADNFEQKELAFLCWVVTVSLFIAGPGRFSADYWLLHRTKV